jgi:hypothetical protein
VPPADAADQKVTGVERLAGFALVEVRIGERGGRVARDDGEPAVARQEPDEILHHAVAEIRVLRVAAEILERQDGDRRLCAGWGRAHLRIPWRDAGRTDKGHTLVRIFAFASL